MPIADNVVEYAVDLVSKPGLIQKEQLTLLTNILVGGYPRASQNLVLASKLMPLSMENIPQI